MQEKFKDIYWKQCHDVLLCTVLKFSFFKIVTKPYYLGLAVKSRKVCTTALETFTAENEEQASTSILYVAIHFGTKLFHYSCTRAQKQFYNLESLASKINVAS